MSTTRIGIVGTENSHADHYIRLFNVEHRHDGFVVTALSGGDTERNRKLAAMGAIERVVEEPASMVDEVDAVIVCSRDGAQHRDEALPFLEAGRSVLVDKPLACNLADAHALIRTGTDGPGLLTSFTALRWQPEIERLRTAAEPEAAYVTGPADAASPYGGLFFYGIHVVELALQLVGAAPLGDVNVYGVPDGLVATADVGDRTAVLHFVRPSEREATYWGILAAGARRASGLELRLTGRDYLAPAVDRFVAMVRSGDGPLSAEELLLPVELMVRIVRQCA